jgi:hypothetical protein
MRFLLREENTFIVRRIRIRPSMRFAWLDTASIRIMMLFMRTTLNISDALLEELREQSQRTGRTLRQVTEDALRRGLSSQDAPARKVRITPFRVGVKPAYRGMSMNQL